MVKNGYIQVIKIIVVLVYFLTIVLEVDAKTKENYSHNYLTLNYYFPLNNSEEHSYFSLFDKSRTQNPFQLTCPENISTYTDFNLCSSDISNSLNIITPDNNLTNLVWEMTGATNDATGSSGINQINDFVFNEGTTIITYSAKDQLNNTATCSYTVIVSDNQVPKIANPPLDITVGTDLNDCGAIVSWNEPIAIDNCTPSNQIIKESSHFPGSSFHIGTTVVTYTINDGIDYNEISYSFSVTVADLEVPVLIAPENIALNCNEVIPTAYANWEQFRNAGGDVTDNCDIEFSSFKFVSSEKDNEVCPYTLIRTYQIADVYGNIGEVVHSIQVLEDETSLKSGTGVLANPTATISGSGTICAGSSANISVLLTGSQPWSITYTDGVTPITVNNISSSPHTISVSPAATKTYTLSAVSDIDGSGTFDGNALVTVNPIPDVIANPMSEIICSGAATNIALTGNVAGTTFSWTVNQSGVTGATDASGNSISQTLTTTGASPGTATYTITPTANGCAGTSIDITITIDPLPTATAGGSQTICSFETATVNGTSFSDGTILWTHNGSGSLTNETTITPTYSAAAGDEGNTVILTMTVTSNNACGTATATATYAVNVGIMPTATANAGGNQTICSNGSATVSGASSSAGTILWTHNGLGSLTNETTLTPTYSAVVGDEGNTVILTLNVNSNNDCGIAIATATYSIDVDALPTATAGGSQTICSNGSATVSGASSSDGTILWTHNGSGSISNATTLTPIYFAVAGDEGNSIILTLTVTSNNSCGAVTASATYIVNVDPLPTAAAGGSQTICVDETTTVSGASSSNGTILWTENGAGTITAGATTLTPTYTAAAADEGNTVTLTMTVTSDNSCTPQFASAAYTITILEELTAPVVSSSQIICYNKPPSQLTATAATGGSGPYLYQWQDSADGSNWSDISGETALNYSPPSLIITTYYRLVTTDDGNPSCGTEPSNSVEISVVDDTPPSFTKPGDITLYADASCNVNTDSTITGVPINPTDNCTDIGDLVIFHSNAANIAGSCTGNYSFIRTWTVTDEAGNSTTDTQTITVIDDVDPIISVPSTISLLCNESNHPDDIGWATATDNCGGTVNITYSDIITPGTCVGRYDISRTWTATDECGNSKSGTQTILVGDNDGPQVTYSTIYVDLSIDTLPTGYENLSEFVSDGGTVTDNCSSIDTFEFRDDYAFGLDDVPGYCPDSIQRYYRITDECGNYTDFTQTVIVTDKGDCSPCVNNNSFHVIDFLGDPEGTHVLTDRRIDKCCDTDLPGNVQCIAFNIRLDDDAVGIEILVGGAAPDFKEWKVDCNSIAVSDGIVCIPGGDFHLFTFCKQGNNPNTYNFISVPGAIVGEDVNARVECGNLLTVEGNISNPVWHSVWPGAVGAHDKYLFNSTQTVNYDTTSYSPLFVPDADAPPVIHYQVCGDLGSTICNGLTFDCAVVTAYVTDSINIDFNINPDVVCEDLIPTITPNVLPAATYILTWYSEYDESGILLHTGPSYTPTSAGAYSVTATDTQEGIPCSSKTFNFDIIFDYTGPTFETAPSPLEIQCNDPGAAQQIQDWLNSATASYIDANGDTINFIPTNDYAGISMICGDTVLVTFTAVDQCSNDSTMTSTITVIDINSPVISPEASDALTDCSTINPGDHPEYLTWLASYGGAAATDDCDNTLIWTADTATATWSGDPANNEITVTFTVTDDCGNTDQTTATFTVIDDQPPFITCPPDVQDSAALNGCFKILAIVTDPTFGDDCSIPTLSWVMSGATTGTGIGTVTGETFNVGVTTVIYIAEDAAGFTDTCSFTVTIIDVTPPNLTIAGCIDVQETAALNNCSKIPVTIVDPTYTDACWPVDSLILTWTMSGATTGSGTSSVVGETFNVGVTTVTYLVTDPDGNTATCDFNVTIVDITPPNLTIAGCIDVQESAALNNCSKIPVTIIDPTYTDACWPVDSLTVTWTMSGATTGSGTGSVVGETFNIGITMVTYTVTDPDGNSSTCDFDVTIIHIEVPQTSFICPVDSVFATASAGNCDAFVPLGTLTINDLCNEIDSVWNESLYRTSYSDASGTYPVGTTDFTWYITDISGNIDSCLVTVIVDDLLPTLACPPDIVDQADFAETFASGVIVPPPTFDDNCPDSTLTWVMTGATTSSGDAGVGTVSIVPSPGTFNVGITTIEYTFTDANGHVITCSFTITIEAAPTIDCPPDTTIYVGVENCISTFDPGIPELIQGAAPIDWTWEMTGATIASGSTPGATPLPDLIGPTSFNVGTTTITWIATNVSGADTCSHTITVIDTISPVIASLDPLEECVESIFDAVFHAPTIDIAPDRPEYFLFEPGNTLLDLDVTDLSDNCLGCDYEIRWRIDFADGTALPVLPATFNAGQLSTYGSEIRFPGDGVTFQDVEHSITYWIVDCNNNVSTPQTNTITVTPRPELIKQN